MIHDHGNVQEVLGEQLSTTLTAARDSEGVVELSLGTMRIQEAKVAQPSGPPVKRRIPVAGSDFRVVAVLSKEEQAALGAFLSGSGASASIAFSADSPVAPVAVEPAPEPVAEPEVEPAPLVSADDVS